MNPPANWYPDPTGRHGQRYWDGEQWTEHVFTEGVQNVDPLEPDATSGEVSEAEATIDAEPDDTPADDTPADEAPADDTPADEAPTRGLFDDPSAQEAWTPEGGDDEVGEEDAAAVAPDVEAEDVVTALDEVGDGPSMPDDAAPPAAAGDMSDAFVLAPETASRIVKRRTAETDAEEAAEEAAEAGEESGPAASAPGAEEQPATAVGAMDAPPPTPVPSTTEDAPPTADAAPTADAPPTADAAPAAATGGVATSDDLGITGDLLGGAFAERSSGGAVALQNSRLLRCSVTPGGAVVARQGTMVAYQGDVSFDRQGAGGVTRALKRAATGEGLAMMRAEGSGDVFFADAAQHVFLLELDGGPGLSVNGRNVLAFSAGLEWEIERVKGASLLAGGLFNTTFTGTGWVALVSDGHPVVLQSHEAPTFVDVNALVAWSAGLSTRIVSSVSAKALVGLGSGEAFQMAFDGHGIVIVQPSEGPLGGAVAT